MKVLLDFTLLNKGGSVQVGLSLINSIPEKNKSNWCIVLSETLHKQLRPEALKGFQSVDVLKIYSKFDRLKLFWVMRQIERAHNPDVVFSLFGPAYWRSRAPHLQGFAHPTIIYPPGLYAGITKDRTLLAIIFDKFKAGLFRRADYLVVETETVKNRLFEYLKFPLERIFVVENSYSPVFKDSFKHFEHNRINESFTFLVPSSYYKHKNLESIFPAALELEKLTNKKFKFIFTLSDKSKEWKRFMSRANFRKKSSFFEAAGVIPHGEIAALYRRSDAVILPSLLECSTAVYPESFMAGIPVITSDLDFARELCGNAALYCAPFSPLEMARSLHRVMIDKGLRRRLSANGKKILKRKYPLPKEKWAKQLKCIEKVFETGKPPRRWKTT